MTRRWPLLLAVLAGATACGLSLSGPADRRWNDAHNTRCAAVIAALEAAPRPDGAGLHLRPAVLASSGHHPHAGGRGCILVGLEPVEWTRLDPDSTQVGYADKDGPDPTYSTFSVTSYEGDRLDIERHALAPARANSVIVREDRGELVHTLITRRSGALRLLSIRRDPRDGDQIRCDAYLFGAYEAALPVLEAACASMDLVPWEVGEGRRRQP